MEKKGTKTVLRCGRLFAARDRSVRRDMAVTVEGERITAVCPFAEAELAGAALIDLSDRFVMPGLIDAHAHLVMDGQLEPFKELLYMNHAASTINGILRVKRDLLAGFTTLRDCGGCRTGDDCAIRDAINGGKLDGPRLLVSGPFHTTSAVHELYEDAGVTIDGPDQARRAARDAIAHGVDQVKMLGIGNLFYDEMRAMVEVAEAMGKLTALHAVDRETIEAGTRAGVTSIEHGMGITEQEIALMAERGTYLIPTYIPVYYSAVKSVDVAAKHDAEGRLAELDPAEAEALRVRYERHAAMLPKILAGGVKVGFGSDVGSNFVPHGGQAYEFVLMVENGMPNADVLLAATRTNAELLRLDGELGSVEAGKYADLVAYRGDPLTDIKTMLDCSFVMKGGEVYKD